MRDGSAGVTNNSHPMSELGGTEPQGTRTCRCTARDWSKSPTCIFGGCPPLARRAGGSALMFDALACQVMVPEHPLSPFAALRPRPRHAIRDLESAIYSKHDGGLGSRFGQPCRKPTWAPFAEFCRSRRTLSSQGEHMTGISARFCADCVDRIRVGAPGRKLNSGQKKRSRSA